MANVKLTTLLTVLMLVGSTGHAAAQTASQDADENSTTKKRSLNDPVDEVALPTDNYVTPDMVARKAFAAPPGAKALSKSRLWVDRDQKRVYVDGYVAMRDGPLEMFACPMGTKEHESVVGTLPQASEVHAALLAVGAKPGKPVRFLPEFKPATGQRIRVWVCWLEGDKFHVTDARRWVQKTGTKQSMTSEWVFAGSGFWLDPSDGRKYYRANSGDMICVSNFSTAMLDVNIASSAEADDLRFSPFTERIPERFMPVRLVLVPLPEDDDQDAEAKAAANKAPTAEILPVGISPPKPRRSASSTR
ncbi:MAG: YdjY domain-containing protein [Pirellulales bacterium]|nr:YdjY domain-containing protein [Pirellulales bacterium]